MAASDHVGDHIMRVVYHSSGRKTPPHEMTFDHHERDRQRKETHNMNHNMHPDIIHAGSYAAAQEISAGSRKYMHEYEIDTSEMSPVTYDDAPAMRETDAFKKKMSGVQQSLWESVPSTGLETLKHGRVQPYRNKAEDEGSISYMIPKSEVGTSRVKYLGMHEINRKED